MGNNSVLLSCFQQKVFDSSNASKCLAFVPLWVVQSKNVYCSQVSHLPVFANVSLTKVLYVLFCTSASLTTVDF